MKLATFCVEGRESEIGLVRDDRIVSLRRLGFEYDSMNDLIEQSSKENLSDIEAAARDEEVWEKARNLSDVMLLAPIPNPRQDVLCIGLNYRDHVEEAAGFSKEAFTAVPDPVFFSKRVSEAPGDGATIPAHEEITHQVDYEVELAVILGKDAFRVREDEVENYIFGYTIVNDMTARDLQTTHKQWYFGKSLDGFNPMGPVIVTADEFAFPPALPIRSYINGELRQDGRTDKLIHSIAEIVSTLSQGITLKAGTIIATGTPKGVAMGMEKPKFLVKGDEIVCEIEGIGTLTNYIA